MPPWLWDVPNALSGDDASSIIFSVSSTNATADNLPGPGRNLGRLYVFGGRRLERVLGRLAAKAGYDASARRAKLSLAQQADAASETSDSTNATEDNLPGAGRIVGLFYSAAGRLLEDKLGKTAERFGRGPHVTAIRIKDRSSELFLAASNSALSPAEVRERYAMLEKDCMLLLKYVRSKSPITQRQALDTITDLSFLDPYVRGLLNVLGALRVIDPILSELDLEPSLESSTRRALVSLSDVRLNTIAKEVMTIRSNVPMGTPLDDSPQADFLFNSLFQYLSDKKLAFLVARHLQAIFSDDLAKVTFHSICKNLDQLAIAFETLDDNMEWETLDDFLNRLIDHLTTKSGIAFDLGHLVKHYIYWSSALERILRYASKLPKTISNPIFVWLGQFEQSDDIYEPRHSWLMLLLLRGIQQASLSRPGTAIANYEQLRSVYGHKRIIPLLRRLACQAEVIFYQLISSTTMDNETVQLNLLQHSTLLVGHPLVVEDGCRTLVNELLGKDEYARQRATQNLKTLHSRDVVCQTAIRTVLEQEAQINSLDRRVLATISALYSLLPLCMPSQDVTWEKHKEVKVFRHCDASGAVVHLFTQKGACDLARLVRGTSCRYEDQICWIRDDVLSMRKFAGDAFDLPVRGYHPIVAGRSKTGENLYVGWVPSTKIASGSPGLLCAVSQGASTATAQDIRGTQHAVHDFFVFLLRYEPAAYETVPRYQKWIPKGAMDATGPYFWKRVRDLGAGEVDPLGALRGLLRISSQ